MGGSTINTGLGSAQYKSPEQGCICTYINLLVLPEETGEFQKLGSKTRSNCDSDRCKEIVYEVGKNEMNLSAGGQTEAVGSPSLQKLRTQLGSPPKPQLTCKSALP